MCPCSLIKPIIRQNAVVILRVAGLRLWVYSIAVSELFLSETKKILMLNNSWLEDILVGIKQGV